MKQFCTDCNREVAENLMNLRCWPCYYRSLGLADGKSPHDAPDKCPTCMKGTGGRGYNPKHEPTCPLRNGDTECHCEKCKKLTQEEAR